MQQGGGDQGIAGAIEHSQMRGLQGVFEVRDGLARMAARTALFEEANDFRDAIHLW